MTKVLAVLNATGAVFNAVMKYSGLVFLALIIVSSSLQVFTRYVLNSALFWTEESARFAFIWATMCGAAIGVKSQSHAAVDFLCNRLTGRWKTFNTLLVNVMILAVGILLLTTGANLTSLVAKQLSPAIRIPMSYVYGAIPVGALAIVVNAVNNILGGLKKTA